MPQSNQARTDYDPSGPLQHDSPGCPLCDARGASHEFEAACNHQLISLRACKLPIGRRLRRSLRVEGIRWGRCPASFELGIPPAAALALALAAAPQHGHLRTCALTRTHMCTALQPRTRTHTDTRTRHTRAHTNTQTQNRRTDSHTVGVGVGRCKGEGRSISEKDGVEDHGGDSGEERRRERGDRLRGSAHRSNF